MGQQDFWHRWLLPATASIAEGMRQRGADGGNEGDYQEAQEQQSEITHDGLHGLFDRNVADQARAVKPEAERRRKQAESHRNYQHHAEMQRVDAELDRDGE